LSIKNVYETFYKCTHALTVLERKIKLHEAKVRHENFELETILLTTARN